MIPHSKPCLGAEELEAVQRVVASGQISQGSEVAALESELAEYLGIKGAVALSSGTAGLHLALTALGAKAGDIVYLPSYVCTALLNAVNYCGAKPLVCDVNPADGNFNSKDFICRKNPQGKAVIVPHMFGNPAKLEPFLQSSLPVIEDCAQAIGATIDGKMVGTIGKIAIFSFYATKVLCAGEGGAVVSDNMEMLEIIRDLRDYDHKDDYKIRYNYKMTELQAAMARVQLKKLPAFIQRRREIAGRYNRAAAESGWGIPEQKEGNIFFRYILFTDEVDNAIETFNQQGITAAKPVFKPLHRYLNLSGYEGTGEIHRKAISLPCYPALSDEEVDLICHVIRTVKF